MRLDARLQRAVQPDYVLRPVSISPRGPSLLGLAVRADEMGKLHNLRQITKFFTSFNLPSPAFMAEFVLIVEPVGGVFLILGLLPRLTGLILAINIFVAYWTADHEALKSIFSDLENFV
jgi:uncharacterized membrane protein YphA (DoxX/SURF4 family)